MLFLSPQQLLTLSLHLLKLCQKLLGFLQISFLCTVSLEIYNKPPLIVVVIFTCLYQHCVTLPHSGKMTPGTDWWRNSLNVLVYLDRDNRPMPYPNSSSFGICTKIFGKYEMPLRQHEQDCLDHRSVPGS